MKILNKAVAVFIVLLLFMACTKEEMIQVNPDFEVTFQREGRSTASAGVPFYIIPTGSGEFLTLYDGTAGHVWGDEGAKGVDFNKADSLQVKYNASGTYKLTIVASSSGDFGNKFERSAKTLDVNVIDERNSFANFLLDRNTQGLITKNDSILFSVPDIVTDFNYKPIFVLDSPLSTVWVNGVQQESDKTQNDFSNPVVYTVRSAEGNEKQYVVKVSTFPAFSGKTINKFSLGNGGNGEVAVIDEPNKIISLVGNYNTNLAAVRLKIESSYASKVYLNNSLYSDRKNYNLSAIGGINKVKVVAQDRSEVEYQLNVISEDPVTSFTFVGLVPAPVGVIDKNAKTISVDVLKGTDVANLVASWTGSVGKVSVSSTIQENGITKNDFSTPKIYTFYKGSSPGDKYTVTVNVK